MMNLKIKWTAIFLTLTAATTYAQVDADAAKELANKSGCMSCHDINNKVVGPAFVDIAIKYKDESGMADVLSQRIMNGAKGAWGRIPMPPNNVSREDAKTLATWVLSITK